MNLALIFQAIVALPKVFQYLSEIGAFLEKMNLDAEIRKIQDARVQLESAKTLSEKVAAARAISDAWKQL